MNMSEVAYVLIYIYDESSEQYLYFAGDYNRFVPLKHAKRLTTKQYPEILHKLRSNGYKAYVKCDTAALEAANKPKVNNPIIVQPKYKAPDDEFNRF